MHFEIQYILQVNPPESFTDLATRAHDTELSIKAAGGRHLFQAEQRREKKEVKKNDKAPKAKEAMSIDTTPLRIGAKAKTAAPITPDQSRRQDKPRMSLRELEQKQYPFPD